MIYENICIKSILLFPTRYSLNDFIRDWAKRENVDFSVLKEWKRKVMNDVLDSVEKLKILN